MKFFLILFLFLLPFQAQAKQSFDAWLKTFKARAAQQGISQSTLTLALANISPNMRVIELDGNQPSAKWTFAKYRNKIVDPVRIKKGREMYQKHYKALKQTEAKYGVPAEIIVALWGVESNFGVNTGGFDVIPALATLAWDGRREKLFTDELIAALKIIDAGHVTHNNMKGSWAGAMGQCQFMPSSFMRLAQDGNGDGKKDIWGTEEDVFASAANYLSKSGWQSGYRWGREVVIPKNFPKNLEGMDVKKPLSFWQKSGVRLPGGGKLPQSDNISASLIAPDGIGGDAFLAYDNFRVIMKWNRSTYFATSVGLIADQIAR